MDDSQFMVFIDVLKDIAENLRRIAFEIEDLHNKEDKDHETVQGV